MRINRYIAASGLCSRRGAEELIRAGKVTINGTVARDLSYQVQAPDTVSVEGNNITPQKHVYILLNKPTNYITTVSDEQGRRTVLDLVKHKIKERIYPVGRLDRNTTGLLVLTSDGALAHTLAHPSHKVEKVYLVTLDTPLSPEHKQQLLKGVRLEDGFARVDKIFFPKQGNKRVVKLSLHSGKNRVIRRLFAKLGYGVKFLDRIRYASLTKKNVPLGTFRHLTTQELEALASGR